MTVSTAINSLLLTFGPIAVAYHGFGLAKYNGYSVAFQGALAFLVTQIAKFILLAFLFPLVFPSQGEDYSQRKDWVLEHDILRSVVSTVDIAGLYFVLGGKRLLAIAGDLEVKILAVALGWATAELASTHLIDIVFH